MMDYWPEINFSLLLILSQFSPGPDQTLVTRSSLLYGVKAGVAVTLGISLGLVAHAIFVITIGSALMQSKFSNVFYVLAACWLMYLAWKIWPKKAILEKGIETKGFEEAVNVSGLFKDALLCNLLNPKCTLFLISLSVPLLEGNRGMGYSVFFVCLVVVVGGLTWFNWVIAFQWKPLRQFYTAHMVAIDRLFSLGLLYFSIFLLVSMFSDKTALVMVMRGIKELVC